MQVLGETIHDQRFVGVIRRLLQAGYLEKWRYGATLSGTPQGGVLETEPRSRDRSACNEVRGQRRTNAATAPASYSTVGSTIVLTIPCRNQDVDFPGNDGY